MKTGLIYSILCKSISEAGDVDYSLNIDRVLSRLTVSSFPHILTKDDFVIHQAYFDLDHQVHKGFVLFSNVITRELLGDLTLSINLEERDRYACCYAPPPIVIYGQTPLLIETFFDEKLAGVYLLQID